MRDGNDRRQPVNVNTATADEIDAVEGLKGHGYEIVRYREERGWFTEFRQLDEVPGLAGKTDEQVLAQLSL